MDAGFYIQVFKDGRWSYTPQARPRTKEDVLSMVAWCNERMGKTMYRAIEVRVL